MESRTQGSRPRTQKKSEAKAKAKDSLSEDRHARGQGQECSRPRPRTKDTNTSALQKKKMLFLKQHATKIFQAISKKKKKGLQKFFKRSPQKNVFQKIFQALHKILTIQKILLSSSRGQANFREDLRPRGQGQELDLVGQGQGLQNVSSRTPPLIIFLYKLHTK